MMPGGKSSVIKIIKELKEEYPYPEILDDSEDAIHFLASALKELAPDGGRLLDIGCGALDKTVFFQRMGYSCFACDDFQDPWHSASGNLDPVVAYAKQAGIEVHAQDQHYTVPWEQESFDVVTMLNVIEHLTVSPRNILNFAGTYLKPGGLLLVEMPNSVNLRKRLSVLRGKSNYTPVAGFFENEGPWRGHIREFTLEETQQIVDWAGFKTEYKKTAHTMVRQRLTNRLLLWVFKGLCMGFPGFRDSFLVGARKPEGWIPREPDPEAMQKSLTSAWKE
jgi:2-polyprenyl-3-methyl-5-hydroxy-6-metoxy-1,4-benzoquinol methylase